MISSASIGVRGIPLTIGRIDYRSIRSPFFLSSSSSYSYSYSPLTHNSSSSYHSSSSIRRLPSLLSAASSASFLPSRPSAPPSPSSSLLFFSSPYRSFASKPKSDDDNDNSNNKKTKKSLKSEKESKESDRKKTRSKNKKVLNVNEEGGNESITVVNPSAINDGDIDEDIDENDDIERDVDEDDMDDDDIDGIGVGQERGGSVNSSTQIVPAYQLHSPSGQWQFLDSAPKPSQVLIIPVEGRPPLPGFIHSIMIQDPLLIAEIRKVHNNYMKKQMKYLSQSSSSSGSGSKTNINSSNYGQSPSINNRTSTFPIPPSSNNFLRPSPSLSWKLDGPLVGIFLVKSHNDNDQNKSSDIQQNTSTTNTTTDSSSSSPSSSPSSSSSSSSTTLSSPPPPSSSSSLSSSSSGPLIYSKNDLHPIGVLCSFQVVHHAQNRLHLALISIRRIELVDDKKDNKNIEKEKETEKEKQGEKINETEKEKEKETIQTNVEQRSIDSTSVNNNLPSASPSPSSPSILSVSSSLPSSISRTPYFHGTIRHFDEKKYREPPTIKNNSSEKEITEYNKLKALIQSIKTNILDIQNLSNNGRRLDQIPTIIDARIPGHFADYASMLINGTPKEYYKILEKINIMDRLEYVQELLQNEKKILEMHKEIEKQVNLKFSNHQEKHVLKEQLKIIQQRLSQLGGSGRTDKEATIIKYKDRLASKQISPDVKNIIDEEMTKFSGLDNDSMEYNLTRNYLDWLTILPWGVYTKENYSIPEAETVLNEDHYGLDDIKNRILEFIAIGKLLGSMPQGKIICFVGPPGVGKTSIGRSIARALGRQFYRFSVGGMDDVAEVKGHRRTYVGAMPGKIIQCLKKTQCANPVILIDEIDKLGRGYRGDPAAALLEVLDPEQNNSFVDHYLDVPVDLSKALFICTANSDDTIPGPLKDRMELIHISGYVQQEKIQIAKHYLIPAVRIKTGVKVDRLTLTDDAIEELIRWYCREPGVRRLNQEIEKLFRKAALKIAKIPDCGSLVISANNLSEYSGKRLFTSDRLYDVTPVGVSMGLAWNSMGGTTIFIEATIADSAFPINNNPITTNNNNNKDNKDKDTNKEGEEKDRKRRERGAGGFIGDMFVTGHLGEVMKESSLIAYTVAKHQLRKVFTQSLFYQQHRIHVHVPEGATPKDGPSAGITMVTALLSLAFNKPMQSNIAMTGEISLTGKVMPIGGVKEKTMAAKRAGVSDIILPYDNRKDWDELPEFVREGIKPHFVSNYEQVREICFPDINNNNTVNNNTNDQSSSDSNESSTTEKSIQNTV